MGKIKKKKYENILIIQKYKGSKIGIVSMLVTLCIAIFCYLTVLYLLQIDILENKLITIISMCRDVLLAIISIIGTSLLTSVFIEKNRKNVEYTELLANDIFASPEFYSNLTLENKKKMNKYLEENIYQKSPIKSEIYQLCREKIYSNEISYYYTELNMSISYFVYDNYTEKNIKRIMKLRTYSDDLSENRLFLFSYNLSPTQDVNNFEVLSAGIGIENKTLEIGKDIIVEKKETKDHLWNKCGYTDIYEVYLYMPITLYMDRDLIINIEYISRVSDGDPSARFGVSVPCKKFYFNFFAPSDYKVYAYTYSFLNKDNIFPNPLYKNNISVCFDNWLLPGEGITICVCNNNIKP